METTLAVEARTGEPGKTTARKIRSEGRIPAVVYAGGGDATSIAVDPLGLQEIFRKTGDRNTVIHLTLDGEDIPCLVRDAQRHPLTRDLLHVDFYRLEPGQVVEVMVPVRGVGRAAGMSIGGRLRIIRREVRVRCEWTKIPPSLDHDIRPLQIGDMVKASDLTLPEGVELVVKNDFNVLTIYGKRAPVAAKE